MGIVSNFLFYAPNNICKITFISTNSQVFKFRLGDFFKKIAPLMLPQQLGRPGGYIANWWQYPPSRPSARQMQPLCDAIGFAELCDTPGKFAQAGNLGRTWFFLLLFMHVMVLFNWFSKK